MHYYCAMKIIKPETVSDELEFIEIPGLNGVCFAKTLVTNAQWAQLSGEEVKGNPRHPKVNISWDDCMALIKKVQHDPEKYGIPEGYVLDLPTEDEWVTACGEDPPEDKLHEYAHFNASSIAEVGTKKPNKHGLYDMLGNAWEWSKDAWKDNG